MPVEVKICGLTTTAALDVALAEGADYVGLVFYPRSPRNLDIATAGVLAAHARASGNAKVVALLVDPSDDLVASVAATVRPDIVQLHGHETVARTAAVRSLAGVPVMKAVSVQTRADVAASQDYVANGSADILLYDAKPPGDKNALPGGNGLAFDWTILDALDDLTRFALAGGLTPGNVAEAIQRTHAPIVDVSSGVETAPGVKDAELIRLFIRNAKTAK